MSNWEIAYSNLHTEESAGVETTRSAVLTPVFGRLKSMQSSNKKIINQNIVLMSIVSKTSDAANRTNANDPIVSSGAKDSHKGMPSKSTHGSYASRENINNDEVSSNI